MSGPLSFGMFSLGMIRTATGIAQNAVESLGKAAASYGKPDGEPSTDAVSFAEVLASEKAASETSIQEIREKLASAIESVLGDIGIPTDPAMTFFAGTDGTLSLESDHERAAEIEANLNEDASIRTLANQLSASASNADRRMVLHSIGSQ